MAPQHTHTTAELKNLAKPRSTYLTKKQHLEVKWALDMAIKDRAQAINAARMRENLEKKQKKKMKETLIGKRDDKYSTLFDGFVESQGFNFGIPVVHKVGQSTSDLLIAFKDQVLGCFNNHFGTAVDTFENIGTSLSDTLGAMTSAISRLVWFVPIFAGIVYLGTKGKRYISLVNILLTIMVTISPLVFGQVKDLIMDLFKRDDDGIDDESETVESQGGFQLNMDNVKNVITSITVTILGLKGAGHVLDMFKSGTCVDSNLMSAIKNASEGAYKATKVSDFVRFALEMVENFINFLSKICGSTAKFSLFKSGQREVDAWVDSVEHIVTEYSVCDRPMDIDSVSLLRQLVNQGEALHKLYKNNRDVNQIMGRSLSRLRALCNLNSAAFSAAVNSRVKPEFALFCGPSGAGKSLFVNHLAMNIMANVLSKEKLASLGKEPAAGVYTPADGDQFFSSYCGQPICVIDDAFMKISLAGQPGDECSSLVRMVNGWSFELPMPDLERKGKEFFRSICVIATTNTNNLRERASQTVYNPEAVTRRVGHGYKVGIAKEFRKAHLQGEGKHFAQDGLDVDKINEHIALNEGFLPEQAWEFYKHNYDTGITSDDKYTFKEVISKIVRSIKFNQEMHKTLDDANRNTFFEAIKERFPEGVQAQAFPGFGKREIVTINEGLVYQHALAKGMLSSSGKPNEHDDGFAVETIKSYFGPVWNRKCNNVVSNIVKTIRDISGVTYNERFLIDFDMTQEDFSAVKQIRGILSTLSRETKNLRNTLHENLFNEESFLEKNPILKYILGGGILMVTLRIMRFAVDAIISPLFGSEEVETQGVSYADANILGIKTDPINSPALYEHIAKNVYSITWETSKPFKIGHVMALAAQTVLVPTHYYRLIGDHIAQHPEAANDELVLRHGSNNRLYVKVLAKEFINYERIEIENKDLSLVHFPISIQVTDMTKKFLTNSDVETLKRNKRFSSVLVSVGSGSSPSMVYRGTDATQYQEKLEVRVNTSYSVRGCWRYAIHTQFGDCGSPLVTGPSITCFQGRCIMGFHTGALVSGTDAFSSAITQEDILGGIKLLQDKIGRLVIHENELDESLIIAESFSMHPAFKGLTSWVPRYRVKPSINFSSKVGFVKSSLFGGWSASTRRPVDFNPIGQKLPGSLIKYGGEVLLFPQFKIKRAMHVAYRIIGEPTSDCSRLILSKQEAVIGVPDNAYIGSINRKSGAGWPHCQPKTMFFGTGDSFDLDNAATEALFKRVDSIILNASRGYRDEHLCQTILKREKLPIEKIEQGKVRAVFGTNLEYLICVRMYFGSFIAALMDKRFDTGCCLGINPYKEWGELAERLHLVSDNIIAGDYKAFDANAQQVIYNEMVELINDWYDDGPVNATIRRTLWLDLTHSRHIVGDSCQINHVVQWFKSLPSGHPMTTTANNIYNMVLFIMCYDDLVPENLRGKFQDNVKGFFFGDDNLSAVSDEAVNYFNQETLQGAMKNYGMTYTTDTKHEAEAPTRSLFSEHLPCTFLKRGFRRENVIGRDGTGVLYTYAPLSLPSALESPYWIATNSLATAEVSNHILVANVETMLTELSAHDPSVWDEYYPTIVKVVKDKLRYTPQHCMREDYQRRFRSAESPYDF